MAKKNKPPKPAKSSGSWYGVVLAVLVALCAVAYGVFTSLSARATQAEPASTKKAMERPPPIEKPPSKDRSKPKVASATQASVAADSTTKRDNVESCGLWAANGECAKNPGFMGSECAASCEGKIPVTSKPPAAPDDGDLTAGWPMPVLTDDLARAQAESDALGRQAPSGCVDLRDDCAALARTNKSGCGEAPVMLTDCRATCKLCKYARVVDEVVGECADKHEQCDTWARVGECAKNKRFMLNGCSRACGVCEAKKHGCSRRNATGGLVEGFGEGSMADMFRRALVDFPQYEPTELSHDPPIIQFENLLDAAEAEVMIDRCRAFGKFERSQAGDQLSPVRTSTQCWCDDGNDCLHDPTVRTLTDRMLNVTRLPYENAEYFQILQYEPGQFYKTHHDQQTAFWTPQGVRVYTFFVYLSEVEAGGGTRFTDLGLTVQPKLGRGILWPSVMTDDLTKGDMRTHHEALAVERGVKHAANLWQHLYDFKSPSRSGLCPFLGQNTNP